MTQQVTFSLSAKKRGFHLITREILQHLPELPQTGLFHLFVKHTSCALSINENADPSVRSDFESIMNKLVPELQPYYTHTLEGADDMPAHIKSSLIGTSVSIPITNGRLNLGTWQGIYFCEFRDYGGERDLIATIIS
jgi:secondary thiamine-phosphate synthase enzyme